MRSLLVLLFVLLSSMASSLRAAPDALEDFHKALRKVFVKHYPEIKATTEDGTVRLDWRTRIFMIHHPLKTGEWQDASEQRGPQKGGIYCEIIAQPGPYQGAAVVPQTFDEHYFSLLLLAPYNKRLDQHLHVRLSYPADVNKEFLKTFREAVGRFGEY